MNGVHACTSHAVTCILMFAGDTVHGGLAVIITNDYINCGDLPPLRGTHDDGDMMLEAFERFNFKCLRIMNLTSENIRRIIASIASSTSLKKCKCIAFCFSGHGSEGVIYGQENECQQQSCEVEIIDDILYPFDPQNAPHLSKIPKLFFIDACRGTGQESGRGKSCIRRSYKGDVAEDCHQLRGGYIIGYSTMPGYKSSLRGKKEVGSVWMPVLAEMLQQEPKRDVLGVLRDNNIAIEKEFTLERLVKEHHQQPEFDCTFSGGIVNLFKIAKSGEECVLRPHVRQCGMPCINVYLVIMVYETNWCDVDKPALQALSSPTCN